MIDWQLIETAPKDSTEILIGWFHEPGQTTMSVAFWNSIKKTWCSPWTQFNRHAANQPTHWTPLPEPPNG